MAVKKNHHTLCGNLLGTDIYSRHAKEGNLKTEMKLHSHLKPDHFQHLMQCGQQLVTHISVLEIKLVQELQL
jgi:hypothetical protein